MRLGHVREEDFDRLVRPEDMIGPKRYGGMAPPGNKRSLTIARHRTSITLEDEFLGSASGAIARAEGKSVAALVGEIDTSRSVRDEASTAEPVGSHQAVRVLKRMQRKARSSRHRRWGCPSSKRRALDRDGSRGALAGFGRTEGNLLNGRWRRTRLQVWPQLRFAAQRTASPAAGAAGWASATAAGLGAGGDGSATADVAGFGAGVGSAAAEGAGHLAPAWARRRPKARARQVDRTAASFDSGTTGAGGGISAALGIVSCSPPSRSSSVADGIATADGAGRWAGGAGTSASAARLPGSGCERSHFPLWFRTRSLARAGSAGTAEVCLVFGRGARLRLGHLPLTSSVSSCSTPSCITPHGEVSLDRTRYRWRARCRPPCWAGR